MLRQDQRTHEKGVHYFLYCALLMIMKGFTIECKCFISRIHEVTTNWWFDPLILNKIICERLASRKSLDVSVPCPRDIPDQTQTEPFINHGLGWPGPGSFIRPPVKRLMTCSAVGPILTTYWRPDQAKRVTLWRRPPLLISHTRLPKIINHFWYHYWVLLPHLMVGKLQTNKFYGSPPVRIYHR